MAKISETITRLRELQHEHGDVEVMLYGDMDYWYHPIKRIEPGTGKAHRLRDTGIIIPKHHFEDTRRRWKEPYNSNMLLSSDIKYIGMR